MPDINRDEIRRLVTALLIESGLRVSDHDPRGDHDDLILDLTPGLRQREGRVRIFHRTIQQRDVNDLAELAAQTGLSEVILIDASGAANDDLQVPTPVQLVGTPELIGRLEDSSVIAWDGAVPGTDRGALGAIRAVDDASPILDRKGLRALPILARNKLPPEFGTLHTPPDELFERLTFLILTEIFRFDGVDLGAAARAQREPDALLRSPPRSVQPFSAVLDCKASRDGFEMSADDERRLSEYVDDHRDQLQGADPPHVIIVSSDFPGRDAHSRRQANLQEQCGAMLCYWKAAELVGSAIAVEASALSPVDREALPWKDYFASGIPNTDIVSFQSGS